MNARQLRQSEILLVSGTVNLEMLHHREFYFAEIVRYCVLSLLQADKMITL